VAQAKPGLLIAMPHSGGSGSTLSLEIGGKPLYAMQFKSKHVRANNTSHPLVALLGCDTGNSAGDYLNHVAVFQDRGAAVVIGTLATVFGDDAPRVAEQIARTLIPVVNAAPTRIGEAMRAMRRQALLDNFLMPLCIVAFGDADWELVH
jgi:ribosomal protein L35AE/L33A